MLHTLWDLSKRHIDPRPQKEQVLPQLSVKVAGQIGQARLDLTWLRVAFFESPGAQGEREAEFLGHVEGLVAASVASVPPSAAVGAMSLIACIIVGSTALA